MSTGPVVVAVLSHRDPPLLRRLVARVLEGEETVVLLHHDPRSEPTGLRPDARLVVVPDPWPCDWGRPALAHTMLRLLDIAVRTVPEMSWLLLVSGQDYPTRHLRETEAELASIEADALLRWFPVPPVPGPDEHPWQRRCRARYLHRLRLPRSHRSLPWPRRHPFGDGAGLFIGDMWVNLRAPAVHHVLEQRRRHSRVVDYLGRCSVADEALLPTLLLNDADNLRITNERRRYIRWVEGRPNPMVLTTADAQAAAASCDWFARKVDSGATAAALDLFDAQAAGAAVAWRQR